MSALVSEYPVRADGSLEVLLIFWYHHQQFDPKTSVDQYFADNHIYRSSSGRLAICFSIAQLSLVEKPLLLGSPD